MFFARAAESERDLISKRTRESLAAKRLAGVKLGRPKGPGKSKPDVHRLEIEALLSNGSTQKFIAQRYRVTGDVVELDQEKSGEASRYSVSG